MEILFEVLHYLVGGALVAVALVGFFATVWVINYVVDLMLGGRK